MTIIAPSLLAADWSDIDKEIEQLTHPSIKWVHFDVMDGKFVPAITYNPEQMKQVSKHTRFHHDVHLMVVDPITQAKKYAAAGAKSITFHYEAAECVKTTIQEIKKLGVQVGISLKPNTDAKLIKPYLNDIDILLVMSVEPGKGGQGFIKGSLERIAEFAKLKNNHNFIIAVDGGIKDFNSKEIIEAGADVLVVGSYIFGSKNYNKAVNKLIK